MGTKFGGEQVETVEEVSRRCSTLGSAVAGCMDDLAACSGGFEERGDVPVTGDRERLNFFHLRGTPVTVRQAIRSRVELISVLAEFSRSEERCSVPLECEASFVIRI
jgi:hypothetical protein